MPDTSGDQVVTTDDNEILEGVVLLVPARYSVRLTIEHGDVFTTSGDVLLLKHAQKSHGVDREAFHRMKRDIAADSLGPGEQATIIVGSAAFVDSIKVVGTPSLKRFDYNAVTQWASVAISGSVGVVVTPVHGVKKGSHRLDEEPSLRAQLAGFVTGIEQYSAKFHSVSDEPTGRDESWRPDRIRIVERDRGRAERLAEALRAIVGQESRIEFLSTARYSSTVRTQLRAAFDADVEVTASALARVLQRAHPEYADGRLEDVALDVGAGRRLTLNRWFDLVGDLYSAAMSEGSEQLVVDGRMVFAGLAKLDHHLRRAVDNAGVAETLWQELDVEPADPSLREVVAWAPDAPAENDRLGRRLVATTLADRLTKCVEQYPGHSFLVHIDGPWGAGKSTLQQFLEADVRNREQPWCVVELDAWRHARAGPPWLLLLTSLRFALRRDGHLPRRSQLRERWRLLGRRNQAAAVACVVLIGLLAGAVLSDLTAFDTASSATLGILTLVGAMWAAAQAVAGGLSVVSSRRGAATFVDTRHDPMEELARHFQWLRRRSPTPLLLVVDDLDRCDHEFVVEFLDSTQKLLRDRPAESWGAAGDTEAANLPSLFVAVAADGRWLRQAYQLIHAPFAEAVGEPGRPLGSLFLDKLFQLQVPVPQLSPLRQETLLRSFLNVQDGDADADYRETGHPVPGEDGATGSGSDGAGDPTQADSQLQAQIEYAGTSEQVIDALADAPTEQRIRAAPLARERLQGQAEAEHTLIRFAHLLEPNPRSVLRFTLAFDVLRASRLSEGNPVAANRLALWAVVVTRWPSLAELLQRDPDAVELFLCPDELADRVPTELQCLFVNPSAEIRNVFNHSDGGPVTSAVIRETAGVA